MGFVQFLKFLGPGLMMCIAFLDPGNLAANVNSGVYAGYSLMWITVWGTIAAWAIQCLSAKLGVTTGSHLAVAIRETYPAPPAFFLFLAIASAVVATDMLEVIGGAIAINGLSRGVIPLWGGVLITCVTTVLILQLQSIGKRALEPIVAVLVAALGASLATIFFTGDPDYVAVLRGVAVPSLHPDTVTLAVASMGALIMPHNLYLHSTLAFSRDTLIKEMGPRRAMRFAAVEAAVWLLVACFINICCIGVFAHGFESFREQGGLGLANVGQALAASYPAAFSYVWYMGLFASAQASTVTTSYTGQFILSGFLRLGTDAWWQRHVPRVVTLMPSLLVAALAGRVDDGFEEITNWLNNVCGLVIPFVLIPLLVLTADRSVMGAFVCRRWHTGLIATICTGILGLNAFNLVSTATESSWGVAAQVAWYAFLTGYVLAALAFVVPPRVMHRIGARLTGRPHVAGAGCGSGSSSSDASDEDAEAGGAGAAAGAGGSKDAVSLLGGKDVVAKELLLPGLPGPSKDVELVVDIGGRGAYASSLRA